MLVGDASIYIIGIPVLAIFVGWKGAFLLGFIPFIIGDIFKVIIASLILPTCWKITAFLFNLNESRKV
jgi:biotin transporter BioY